MPTPPFFTFNPRQITTPDWVPLPIVSENRDAIDNTEAAWFYDFGGPPIPDSFPPKFISNCEFPIWYFSRLFWMAKSYRMITNLNYEYSIVNSSTSFTDIGTVIGDRVAPFSTDSGLIEDPFALFKSRFAYFRGAPFYPQFPMLGIPPAAGGTMIGELSGTDLPPESYSEDQPYQIQFPAEFPYQFGTLSDIETIPPTIPPDTYPVPNATWLLRPGTSDSSFMYKSRIDFRFDLGVSGLFMQGYQYPGYQPLDGVVFNLHVDGGLSNGDNRYSQRLHCWMSPEFNRTDGDTVYSASASGTIDLYFRAENDFYQLV